MTGIVGAVLSNVVLASLLAVIALLVGRFGRRPVLTHALWVIVLLKLITPPMIRVPVPVTREFADSFDAATNWLTSPRIPAWTSDAGNPYFAEGHRSNALVREFQMVGEASVSGQMPPPSTGPTMTWPQLLSGMAVGCLVIACVGTLMWFAAHLRWIRRFSAFVTSGRSAPARTRRDATRMARQMGIRNMPRILLIDGVLSPMLWAPGRQAYILLPRWLFARLTPRQKSTLIAHELAHYRRGDHWVRMLEFFVTGLYWWHPVVWLARREIEATEEQCCDSWVVEQLPNHHRSYAEALLDTLDFLNDGSRKRLAPVSPSVSGSQVLRARLRQILGRERTKHVSPLGRVAVVVFATLVLTIGAGSFRAPPSVTIEESYVATDRAARDAQISGNHTVSGIHEIHADITAPLLSSSATTPQMERELLAPGNPVKWQALATSPCGRYVALMTANGEVLLRDSERECVATFGTTELSCLAFSPDGSELASGGRDGSVRIWNCSDGTEKRTLRGRRLAITSISYSPDGSYLASGDAQGTVKIVETATFHDCTVIQNPTGSVSSVRFSSSGDLLAVSSASAQSPWSGRVLVWNVATNALRTVIECRSPVTIAQFSRHSNAILTAEHNGQVTLWSGDGQTPLSISQITQEALIAAAFSPNCDVLNRIDGSFRRSSRHPVIYN